jgi:solute carrier family 30 (zinc transporter), member 2
MKEKEGKLVPLFKIAFICLVFSLVELLSGIEAHSLSVVSDAAHVFSDLISVLIAILSLYLQDKASSPDLPFGYSGVETIGAIANLVLVWRLTYYLLTEAVEKINTRDRVEHPLLMLLISVVGLAANYFMAQLLHSSEAAALLGHSCHSHDCHTD